MKDIDKSNYIRQNINIGIELRQAILNDENFIRQLNEIACQIISTIEAGGKLLICGNGGSAADAQHFAAELVGRFEIKFRNPLSAIALTVDSSCLTAISNDFGYESVFSRQVEALGNEKDLLVGISTSGNSKNVLNALQKAKQIRMKTISLLGGDGGDCKKYADYFVIVPSNNAARVQEMHITFIHLLCGIVDLYFSE